MVDESEMEFAIVSNIKQKLKPWTEILAPHWKDGSRDLRNYQYHEYQEPEVNIWLTGGVCDVFTMHDVVPDQY